MTKVIATTLKILTLLPKAIAWVRSLFARFADWQESRKLGAKIKDATNVLQFKPTRANERLLGEMYTLGNHFLHTSTGTPWHELWDRFRLNPGIYTALVPAGQPGAHPAGYFVMLPLSRPAQAALRDGKVRSSRDLRAHDIVEPTDTLEAVYVSAVYGGALDAMVAVSNALLEKIIQLRTTSGLRFIFVRPTTAAGRALFQSLTGRSPNRDARLEVIDLEEAPGVLTRVTSRLERARRISSRRSQSRRNKTTAAA